MCYKCEVLEESGLFRKRISLTRCCLCFFGVVLVICLGFGVGLMAFYLPTLDMFDETKIDSQDETQSVYSDLVADLSGENRMFLLSNDSDCVNYDDIKPKYKGKYIFKCNSTFCLPADLRCNGYYECDDQSDEETCEEFCQLAVKADIRFMCTNPKTTANDPGYGPEFPPCYLSSYRCDGGLDCPDDSPNDNQLCPENSYFYKIGNRTGVCSLENNFLCSDKEYCVRSSVVCDGITDCSDGSDENGC